MYLFFHGKCGKSIPNWYCSFLQQPMWRFLSFHARCELIAQVSFSSVFKRSKSGWDDRGTIFVANHQRRTKRSNTDRKGTQQKLRNLFPLLYVLLPRFGDGWTENRLKIHQYRIEVWLDITFILVFENLQKVRNFVHWIKFFSRITGAHNILHWPNYIGR